MLRSARLLELIGFIYDAALAPERWSACLTALGAAVHAPAIGLFPILPGTMFTRSTMCVGHDARFLALYDARYGNPEVNPYAQGVTPDLLRPGTVIRPEALCPDRELHRTEYYHEWLSPQGIGAGAFAILGSRQAPIVLSIARRPSVGHLDTDELGLVHAIVPHLQRALGVGELLDRLTAERQATEATLDLLPVAVILLDDAGRPILLNRRAISLVTANDALGIDPAGVRAATVDTTATLRHCIAEASDTSLGRGTSAGGVLSLPRPSGRRPLAALVTPIARRHWEPMAACAAAALLVSDPDDVAAPPVPSMRELWGLTRAEAALASRLAAGLSLTDAARELGVTLGTARSQLARIFVKTGTDRQAELVRVLATTLPRVGVP